MHRQQVHDALREAHEEQLVIDRLRAAGLLALAVRIVQEHQVEIRGVAELHAAELAVADRADVHRARLRPAAAQRHAELRGDLPPAELHRALDDELGDVGEAVAHLHERQQAGEVGHRDAKQRGALELAQRLDLLLGVVLAQLLHALGELAREVGARRQPREQPLVDQLIEQQRVRGDLRGEKITVTAQLDQARARRGVLAQQREVGRALAGRLDDGEHPPQHRQLRAAVRDVREQRRQQRLQTLAPGLIELAHQRRGAQLEQQPRSLGAVAKARLGERFGERRGLRLAVPEASRGRCAPPAGRRCRAPKITRRK